MDAEIIIRQILELAMIMSVGYIARKKGLMSGDAETIMSRLVVNVICPMLILHSVTESKYLNDTRDFVMIFATAVIYYVILPFIAIPVVKLLKISNHDRGLYISMFVYSNIGFMGIPIISSIFGADAVLYVSVFMAIFNVSVFSYGYILIGGDTRSKISWKKMLNPGTVSSFAAIVMYVCHLHFPDIIDETLQTIGNATTPLAMIVVGSMLAASPLRAAFEDRKLLIFSITKMVIFPIIVGVISKLFIDDDTLRGVLVVLTAMPVATNTAMLCRECGKPADLVAKGTFVTTILSIVTIPGAAYLAAIL